MTSWRHKTVTFANSPCSLIRLISVTPTCRACFTFSQQLRVFLSANYSQNEHHAQILLGSALSSHSFMKLLSNLFYFKLASYSDIQPILSVVHTMCDPVEVVYTVLTLQCDTERSVLTLWTSPFRNGPVEHVTAVLCIVVLQLDDELADRVFMDLETQLFGLVHWLLKQEIWSKESNYCRWKYSDHFISRIKSFY